jgi:hypothetical protein
MGEPSYCRVCGTRLLGDRELAAGICGTCATPRRWRRHRRLLRKSRTCVCQQCGVAAVQTVMGRLCPARRQPPGDTAPRVGRHEAGLLEPRHPPGSGPALPCPGATRIRVRRTCQGLTFPLPLELSARGPPLPPGADPPFALRALCWHGILLSGSSRRRYARGQDRSRRCRRLDGLGVTAGHPRRAEGSTRTRRISWPRSRRGWRERGPAGRTRSPGRSRAMPSAHEFARAGAHPRSTFSYKPGSRTKPGRRLGRPGQRLKSAESIPN